jgi:hypothetical protein
MSSYLQYISRFRGDDIFTDLVRPVLLSPQFIEVLSRPFKPLLQSIMARLTFDPSPAATELARRQFRRTWRACPTFPALISRFLRGLTPAERLPIIRNVVLWALLERPREFEFLEPGGTFELSALADEIARGADIPDEPGDPLPALLDISEEDMIACNLTGTVFDDFDLACIRGSIPRDAFLAGERHRISPAGEDSLGASAAMIHGLGVKSLWDLLTAAPPIPTFMKRLSWEDFVGFLEKDGPAATAHVREWQAATIRNTRSLLSDIIQKPLETFCSEHYSEPRRLRRVERLCTEIRNFSRFVAQALGFGAGVRPEMTYQRFLCQQPHLAAADSAIAHLIRVEDQVLDAPLKGRHAIALRTSLESDFGPGTKRVLIAQAQASAVHDVGRALSHAERTACRQSCAADSVQTGFCPMQCSRAGKAEGG